MIKTYAEIADTVADRIIEDLREKWWFRQEWDQCDEKVTEEIQKKWKNIIFDAIMEGIKHNNDNY